MSLTVFLVIFVMLLLNGVFAGYELALASVRAERLRHMVEQRRRGAGSALSMKDRMEKSLAVVQLGLTICSSIAGAAGGASVEEKLVPYFKNTFHLSEAWADLLALTCVVVPLSAGMVIIGELIPKVFAIKNSELVVTFLSPMMWVFGIVAYPAVWFLEWISNIAVALLEKLVPTGSGDQEVGLHELRAQVNLLRAGKVIGVQEERIIIQASRLSSIKVGEIMLPEDDIVMVIADAPLSENLIIAHMDLHTRFPVTAHKGDPQAIIGYVTFKDMMLLAKTHPGNPVLREVVRSLISLPRDMTLSDALRRMTAEHLHLALVRGEGGKVVGMITQEDIFEELVGDIQDEFDRLPKHISPSGNQLVVGGGVTLKQLRDHLKRQELGANLPPQTTLNDWVNHGREDSLRGGDTAVIDGLWIQVRKVRRRRITEALLDPSGNPFEAKQSAAARETKASA